MKLATEQIRSIAFGVERVEEINGLTYLLRFTEDETELYKNTSDDFYKKTFATAGVTLEFTTNSSALAMEVEVSSGSSRKYFSHRICVNGEPYASLCANTDTGIFGGSWSLPEGEKTIKMYFPWSVRSSIKALELDDGATLVPATRNIRMTSYGDSITHGYDASSPELSYASMLADALNADSVNKGIGAEIFYPSLSALSGSRKPTLITVAYGTNDWAKGLTREEYLITCRDFYKNLSDKNPDAKIFAITPIWRKHWQEVKAAGPFTEVNTIIEDAVKDIPNVICINGYGFVHADRSLFSPDGTHPNDSGFSYYGNELTNEIKKYL